MGSKMYDQFSPFLLGFPLTVHQLFIKRGLAHEFHAKELPLEQFMAGNTRFQRWHIDAPLYDRDPAWITALRCLQQPKGPDVTINWDDGSGYSMKSPPGRTAFFSNVQLYDMLSPEEQKMADHSWVRILFSWRVLGFES